jgi:5'-nucleotidase
MRPENRDGEGECYQVNSKVQAIYNDTGHQLVSLKVNNEPFEEDVIYTICVQGYHVKNSKNNLNITMDELTEDGNSRVVTTSIQDVLVEYLRYNQNISRKIEGRLQYIQ